MVVIKNRNYDKKNIPVILTVVFCIFLLILTFVYYADIGSENITIFSRLNDFFKALGEFFANRV